MLKADRDALLCDFAEVYHIYSFNALPAHTLAALAVGLRDDSRIKMKMSGMVYVSPVITLAAIADNVALIRHWLCMKEGTPLPVLYTDIVSGASSAIQTAREAKENDTKYISVRNVILDDVRARLSEVEGNV